MSNEKSSFKILIADDDFAQSRRLGDFLTEKGFESIYARGERSLVDQIEETKPHFVIMNIIFGSVSARDVILKMKEKKLHLKTKVLVTSAHNSKENVRAVLSAGATDYIVKPYRLEDMVSRLVFLIQSEAENNKRLATVVNSSANENTVLKLLEIVLREVISGKTPRQILFNHTKMLAITLKAVRASVIECCEDRQTGYVVASSDDREVCGLKIDLNKYPEVIHVMNTEQMVVIENMEEDPTMKKVLEVLNNVRFNALIVAPIWKRGQFYGVVSARMPKAYSKFTDSDIRFAQMLSLATSCLINSDQKDEIKFDKNNTAA